jgi:hypothetical protein
VGLLEKPAESGELVAFAVEGEAALEVHVDPRYLVPPYVKKGELLFHVEGYGRFRLGLVS